MATDMRKLGVGAVVLVVSSLLILATSVATAPIPSETAALAALGIAIGTLLVGLSNEDIGV
ncbi:MAG: hypothetical protein V5A36_03825 [Natronomonas sp.]